MNPGLLRERVELFRPVDTEDGRGGRTRRFESIGNVWAEAKRPSARDIIAAGVPAGELMRELRLRSGLTIARGWRVKLDGRLHEVAHVYPYDRAALVVIIKEIIR